MAYKAFNQICASGNTSVDAVKSNIISNQPPAEVLHKAIIRKFEKHKINVWITDLADMHLSNIRDLVFHFVLLIFLVTIHRLFL